MFSEGADLGNVLSMGGTNAGTRPDRGCGYFVRCHGNRLSARNRVVLHGTRGIHLYEWNCVCIAIPWEMGSLISVNVKGGQGACVCKCVWFQKCNEYPLSDQKKKPKCVFIVTVKDRRFGAEGRGGSAVKLQ